MNNETCLCRVLGPVWSVFFGGTGEPYRFAVFGSGSITCWCHPSWFNLRWFWLMCTGLHIRFLTIFLIIYFCISANLLSVAKTKLLDMWWAYTCGRSYRNHALSLWSNSTMILPAVAIAGHKWMPIVFVYLLAVSRTCTGKPCPLWDKSINVF